MRRVGEAGPRPSATTHVKGDPAMAVDLRDHALALIALREVAADAAA